MNPTVLTQVSNATNTTILNSHATNPNSHHSTSTTTTAGEVPQTNVSNSDVGIFAMYLRFARETHAVTTSW